MRNCLSVFIILGLALSTPVLAAPSKLAIIIDDVGYNLALGRRSVDLPGNFTIAVLPFTPHGIELAERAHQRGKEIMLHAPMSNEHNYPLGRGGLTNSMQQSEFLAVLRQNLANIPHIKGVNNHMGSLLTQKTEAMQWLMAELKTRNLYFVDSRTTAKTQALRAAESIQLPSRRRDVFLDDTRTIAHIRQQFLLAVKKAQSHGSAIAIGHPYRETLQVLEDIQGVLAENNVELVSASALMLIATSPAPSPTKIPISPPRLYCLAPPMSLWPQISIPSDPFVLDRLTEWLME